MGEDLSDALNFEILALAEAGCAYIQIDEPVFARKPEETLSYGVEHLERCFRGVPASVERIVHICCGYPQRINQKNYLKANPSVYFSFADALERAKIDAISFEDAHRHNDLSLLERFRKTKILLGVIAIAESRVETVEEIEKRLREALNHIDKERLIVAPDCGLGMLDRKTAKLKLSHMVQAAHALN